MLIEFQNTVQPKNHSAVAVAIVITACAFFFIPTTLIILGYYSSQPTGTLVSPLPQGVLSEQPTPTAPPAPTETSETPADIVPSVTPQPNVEQPVAENPTPDNQPIIAADNSATSTATSNVTTDQGSNIVDKVATIDAGTTEKVINDPEVTENSQVYLSPRPDDKAIYSVGSKKAGQFTIAVGDKSDTVRYIDYHIVNP